MPRVRACVHGCQAFYLPSIVLTHKQVKHFRALCKARGVDQAVLVATLIRKELSGHPLHGREL